MALRGSNNGAVILRAHGPTAEAFSAFTSAVHTCLPQWLRRVLPATFIGFALINSCTFFLDLVFLWLTHAVMGINYPVAVSVSFGLAAMIAFFFNKVLNFRSHGDMGKQSTKYALVIVSNYLIWIVGFSTLLEWLGVHYLVSRIVAACCEGIYIYLCSRLWVFRPGTRGARARRSTVPATV